MKLLGWTHIAASLRLFGEVTISRLPDWELLKAWSTTRHSIAPSCILCMSS